MSASPASTTVANTLTAQATLFDSELIPNLKGQTNAFVKPAVRVVQGLHMGVNRQLFMYSELAASLAQSGDGVIGSPEYVGQITTPAQVGEWSNFGNFSAMSVGAAIDDVVGNSAIEGSYQAGQTISELYSETLDATAAVDSLVNQNALLSTPFTLDLNTVRTLKQSLVSSNVMPCKNGEYCGQISPNVAGDLYNGTTVNDSLIDVSKYTESGRKEFAEIAGSDQLKEFVLFGTNIRLYQTPFVLQTANYGGSGKIGFRTYVEGLYSHIGIWLEVPGDTDLKDGDWRTISCGVTKDAPSSVYDPTATIGAWWYYRFHQTVVTPSNGGISAGTQRVRVIDSVPFIQ